MLAYEADGRGADVDLRPVSDGDAAGVRPADRLRANRTRSAFAQFGDRRAHRTLSRPARHLLRDHRARAGDRTAPGREPRRRALDLDCRTSRPALQGDDQFFAVLGHLVGKIAERSIPVIDGIVVPAD